VSYAGCTAPAGPADASTLGHLQAALSQVPFISSQWSGSRPLWRGRTGVDPAWDLDAFEAEPRGPAAMAFRLLNGAHRPRTAPGISRPFDRPHRAPSLVRKISWRGEMYGKSRCFALPLDATPARGILPSRLGRTRSARGLSPPHTSSTARLSPVLASLRTAGSQHGGVMTDKQLPRVPISSNSNVRRKTSAVGGRRPA